MKVKGKPFTKYSSQKGCSYEGDANRFTLKCQLISLALVIAMWILNQIDIFIVDKEML